MHQILRNYFILLLFCFYSVLGISPKLSIVEYRPFPEKISLLGIEPTQLNWSIANKFLLPKALKENGVKEGEMDLQEGTFKEIIRNYTRELDYGYKIKSQ